MFSKCTYGSNPIPLTFHIPKASAKQLQAMYTNLTPNNLDLVPSVSNLANRGFMLKIEVIGVLNNMNTIMMLKICNELPVMYIPIAFIGSCLAGPMAISHAFFIFSVSISSVEGALLAFVDARALPLPPDFEVDWLL